MPTQKRRRRGSVHPWLDWFAAGVFTLRKGIDYRGRTYAMAQQVRARAARYGLSVSIAVSPDEDSISVEVLRAADSKI